MVKDGAATVSICIFLMNIIPSDNYSQKVQYVAIDMVLVRSDTSLLVFRHLSLLLLSWVYHLFS